MPRQYTRKPLAERFWAKVDVRGADDCWLWLASCSNGYGQFQIDPWPSPMHKAHRVAWRFTYGEIPSGLVVLHRCDTPPCCNPGHLRLGTQADNLADMRAKGRARETVGGAKKAQPGERNAMSKLTLNQVGEIRSRYAAGGVSQRSLARTYKVSQMTISLLVRHVTWA